ncbi:MAG TPA: hypothetical protein VGQ60_04595 [Nitrospiraceae bacterium]|jgi:hypothetical protein|nr:hypothetical protein [Nitrospiraceae bacterium]
MPASSSPFFVAEGDDARFYRAAAKAQEFELSRCAGAQSCSRAHFTRGLIALFESRATAAVHFQAVLAAGPKSHLADSSRAWLQLLRNSGPEEPESVMVVTTKRLVRDMLEREQTTKRELNARERKLEEMGSQLKKAELVSDKLEALKRIEQEMKEKSRPMKPATKPQFRITPASASTDLR